MQQLRDFLERTLIVWLTLSSGAALIWGASTAQAINWFNFWKDMTMTPAIVSAMFSIGFLLPRAELWNVIRQIRQVFAGCATQYLCMPLLAYLIAELLQLDGPFYTGMILTGCVPGAMASNVLTLAAKGNVSYSISLTTVSTLISPLAVPLLLLLFLGVKQGPDPLGVFLNLLQTVALPVLLGFAFQQCLTKTIAQSLGAVASLVANLAILWIIAVAIGLNAARLQQVTVLMLAALLLLNLAGYFAGHVAAGLFHIEDRKRRALILEIGMQNAGVGTILALQFFEDTATAIPTAVYTFGCMFTGTLLANYWNWKTQAEQNSPSSTKGDDEHNMSI